MYAAQPNNFWIKWKDDFDNDVFGSEWTKYIVFRERLNKGFLDKITSMKNIIVLWWLFGFKTKKKIWFYAKTLLSHIVKSPKKSILNVLYYMLTNIVIHEYYNVKVSAIAKDWIIVCNKQ